jgi:hypothetical protein
LGLLGTSIHNLQKNIYKKYLQKYYLYFIIILYFFNYEKIFMGPKPASQRKAKIMEKI